MKINPPLLRRLPVLCLLSFLPACVSLADTVADRKADLIEDHVLTPYTDPNSAALDEKFWGRAAYALAAYYTNVDLTTADSYVISLYDDPALQVPVDDTIIFNGFFGMSLVTRLALDPTVTARMSATAKTKLLATLWNYVDRRSKVAIAGSSPANIWRIDGSENINAMRHSNCYLAVQVLKNAGAPYGPNATLTDGFTLQQHFDAWNQYWCAYFTARAREGIHIEVGSPTYEKYTIPCYYNLRDFAADTAVLRPLADKFLTLFWAEVANDFVPNANVPGGAMVRAYKDTYISTAAKHGLRPFLYMYDWHDTDTGDLSWPLMLCAAMSSYVPPETVRACAIATNKAPYLFSARKWGLGTTSNYTDPTGYVNALYQVSFPSHLRRDSYSTPDYVMGAMTYNSTKTYTYLSGQNRAASILFNSGLNDRMIFLGMGAAADVRTDIFGITGLCRPNAMVIARDKDVKLTTTGGVHVLFSSGNVYNNRAEDDPTTHNDWVFSQSGDSYVALRVATGGYSWVNAGPTDAPIPNAHYLELTDPWSPVVVQCGRVSTYATFLAFKTAVRALAFDYGVTAAGAVTYTTLDGETLTVWRQSDNLPKVNGTALDLNPTTAYSSPYLSSTYGTNLVTVSYPSQATLALDFTDAYTEAETGTVNAPMVSATDGPVTYLHTPNGGGDNLGNVVLPVTLGAGGTYYLWARVYWLDGGSNSLYSSVDGSTNATLGNDSPYGAWRWVKAPVSYSLTAGAHSVTITTREDGSRFDRLLLTTSATFDPNTL